MVKKITFLAKIIGIFFCSTIISNAIDLKIIPLKKPKNPQTYPSHHFPLAFLRANSPIRQSECGVLGVLTYSVQRISGLCTILPRCPLGSTGRPRGPRSRFATKLDFVTKICQKPLFPEKFQKLSLF